MPTLVHTESFTMNGTDAFIRTAHPIAFRPSVFIVAGVPTNIKQLYVDPNDATSWYWTAQSFHVFVASVVPPVNGTIITITYESSYSNLVSSTSTSTASQISTVNDPLPPGPDPDPDPVDDSQDYTPPAQSGIIQRVYDIPGTVGSSSAASQATGITRQASLIPLAITGTTQWPAPKVGQKVPVNLPDYGLDGNYIVMSLSAKSKEGVDLGHGTSFETVLELVELVDPPTQSPADTAPPVQTVSSLYPIYSTTPLEQLKERTSLQPTPLQDEPLSIILGSGGDLVAGLQIGNKRPVLHSGTLIEIYAIARTPPESQALVIDVMQDGESIFGPRSLVIPSGGTAIYGVTQFLGYPGKYRMRRGAVITFSVGYLIGTGTPVAARDVTVYGRWVY